MGWSAPQITRASWPPGSMIADERTLADQLLDFHRQTLLWKCGGLTAEQGHADLIRERIDGQAGH